MIQTIEWEAVERTPGKKSEVKQLRQKGFIPAEIYGKGHSNAHIYIRKKDLLSRPHGNFLIHIKLESEEEPRICILKDIQYNYLGDEPIHVDLYEVTFGVELEVEVPIELVGTPKGVELGGVLEQHLHSVLVKTVPRKIPEELKIDVSDLGLGDVLYVRDIQTPEDVKIITPPDEVVAVVSEPEEEVVEEEIPEEAVETEETTS